MPTKRKPAFKSKEEAQEHANWCYKWSIILLFCGLFLAALGDRVSILVLGIAIYAFISGKAGDHIHDNWDKMYK